MKKALFLLAALIASTPAAAVWIEGYTRPDGIYVPGHWSDEPKDYAKEDRDYQQQSTQTQQNNFDTFHHKPDLNQNLYGSPLPQPYQNR